MTSKVVVFHCVPHDIDAAVERFWRALDVELGLRGAKLFLISTCDVKDDSLNVINIPYNLTDIKSQRESSPSESDSPFSTSIDRLLSRWYRVPLERSAAIHRATVTFITQVFDLIQPDAVISWQSSHPLSRITREYCVANDLKWWSAERGWISDTLMFDLAENNFLSDINQSVVARRAYAQYVPEKAVLESLKSRSIKNGFHGRYPDGSAGRVQDRRNKSSVRERLGIAPSAPLWVFFSHGEPHVNCRAEPIQRSHRMSVAALDSRVAQIARIVGSMGGRLIVREHPFNRENGRLIASVERTFIAQEQISLDELFEQADVGLFTLSTLQFSWVLHGKKVGFLCNGLLTIGKEIPNWADFSSGEDFVNSCLDDVGAPHRQKMLERRISFLYQMQLIDVAEQLVDKAARELADLVM